jgi:hypothetical protein
MIRINAMNELNADQIRQQVRQMLGNWSPSPLTTLHVGVEYARDNLLIQRNKVRNRITGTDDDRLRVSLSRPDRCSVLVIPLLADYRVVLSVRYCYAAARWSLQLPRLDEQEQDEGWCQAAERCLAEGAGMVADQWSLAGNVYFDPHWSPTSLALVLAKNCRRLPTESCQDVKPRQDANLVAGTIAVGADTLEEMIRDGDIDCGITMAGLAMLRARDWR